MLAGDTDEHRDAVFCEGGRLQRRSSLHGNEAHRGGDPQELYWPRVNLQRRIPEHTKAAMCRTRDFKYVRRLYGQDELYDLRADPHELCNRISDPKLARGKFRTELSARLLTWHLETCDVVPLKRMPGGRDAHGQPKQPAPSSARPPQALYDPWRFVKIGLLALVSLAVISTLIYYFLGKY